MTTAAQAAVRRQEHPEYMPAWREAHRSHQAAYSRAYSLAHPEVGARYRARHRELLHAKAAAWRQRNPLANREKAARYKARKVAVMTEPVDLCAVLARDGWTCYLCGQGVSPKTLSFDHVVPLARGGPHIEANLRVAHALCNSQKGASLAADYLAGATE